MAIYQLLSAVGPDRPGIVSRLTKILFQHGCNLEDSAMMRLGSEFGIQLIFTGRKALPETVFSKARNEFGLSLQLKKISLKLASSRRKNAAGARVIVHGGDKPGIVYQVTKALSQRKFNITDLATHRTTHGGKAGYLLFIEGDLQGKGSLKRLSQDLQQLARRLKVTIRLDPVSTVSL